MSIEWSGFTAGDNFVSKSGQYDSSSNSQTSLLTVKSPAVIDDKTYTCTIKSLENPKSDEKSVDVDLKTFG